jgi:hypothetical protein
MIPAKIFVHRGLFRSVNTVPGTVQTPCDPRRHVKKGDSVIVQNWVSGKAKRATVTEGNRCSNTLTHRPPACHCCTNAALAPVLHTPSSSSQSPVFLTYSPSGLFSPSVPLHFCTSAPLDFSLS